MQFPAVIWDLVLSCLPLGQREYFSNTNLVHAPDLSREQLESWQIKNDKLHDCQFLEVAVSLGSTLSLSVIKYPPVRVRALFPSYMAREMLDLLLKRTLERKSFRDTCNAFSTIDAITSLESLQWHEEMRFVYWKKCFHDESECGTTCASTLTLVQVRQLTMNAIKWKQLPLLKHLHEQYDCRESFFHDMLSSSDEIIIWMMQNCVDRFYAVTFLVGSPLQLDILQSRSPQVLELLHPIVQEVLTMNLSIIASEAAVAIHRYKPFALKFFDIHKGSTHIRPEHWHFVKELESMGILKETKSFLFSHLSSLDEWIAYCLIHFPEDLDDLDSNTFANFIHMNMQWFQGKLTDIYKVESVIYLVQHGYVMTQENLILLFNRGISIRQYYSHFDSHPITQELINAMTHADYATSLCEIYMQTHDSFPFYLEDDIIEMCIHRNKTWTLALQLSNPNYLLRYEHLLMMCKKGGFANVVTLDRFLNCIAVEDYESLIVAYKLWYPQASGLLLYEQFQKQKTYEWTDWYHCCGLMLRHFFHDLKHIFELQSMFQLQWKLMEFHANQ